MRKGSADRHVAHKLARGRDVAGRHGHGTRQPHEAAAHGREVLAAGGMHAQDHPGRKPRRDVQHHAKRPVAGGRHPAKAQVVIPVWRGEASPVAHADHVRADAVAFRLPRVRVAHALALPRMLYPPVQMAREVLRVAGGKQRAVVQRKLRRGRQRRVCDYGHEPRREGLHAAHCLGLHVGRVHVHVRLRKHAAQPRLRHEAKARVHAQPRHEDACVREREGHEEVDNVAPRQRARPRADKRKTVSLVPRVGQSKPQRTRSDTFASICTRRNARDAVRRDGVTEGATRWCD